MPNKLLCCLRAVLLIVLSLIVLISSAGCSNAAVDTENNKTESNTGNYTDEAFDADKKSGQQSLDGVFHSRSLLFFSQDWL